MAFTWCSVTIEIFDYKRCLLFLLPSVTVICSGKEWWGLHWGGGQSLRKATSMKTLLSFALGEALCLFWPLKGAIFVNKIGLPCGARALLSQRKLAAFQDSTVSSHLFAAVIIYAPLTACSRADTSHSVQEEPDVLQQFHSTSTPALPVFFPGILSSYLAQEKLLALGYAWAR